MTEKNCTTRCSNNASRFWERWGNGGEPEAVAAVSFARPAILPAITQGVEVPDRIAALQAGSCIWSFALAPFTGIRLLTMLSIARAFASFASRSPGGRIAAPVRSCLRGVLAEQLPAASTGRRPAR